MKALEYLEECRDIKIEYVSKDIEELLESLDELIFEIWIDFKEVVRLLWNTGINVLKLIAQISTFWELLIDTKIARWIGKILAGLKKK